MPPVCRKFEYYDTHLGKCDRCSLYCDGTWQKGTLEQCKLLCPHYLRRPIGVDESPGSDDTEVYLAVFLSIGGAQLLKWALLLLAILIFRKKIRILTNAINIMLRKFEDKEETESPIELHEINVENQSTTVEESNEDNDPLSSELMSFVPGTESMDTR